MKNFFLISSYKILKKILFFSILCLSILANNIENERKYLELEKRQQELKKEKFSDDVKHLETKQENNEEPLFYIEKIELSDKYKLFKKKEIKKIEKKYENKSLKNSEVKQLLFDFINQAVEKGYTTTRVGISQDRGYDGKILRLEVHAGKIDSVILNNDNFFDKAKVFTSFPTNKNKILKLQDIEQMVDQFNKINSNNLKIDIIPGRYNETSTLKLENIQTRKFILNLSYNNYGNESTGRDRGRLDFSYDNLFGINDNIYLIYQRGRNSRLNRSDQISRQDWEKEKLNEDWYLNYSFPFRNWSFSMNYSHSYYKNSYDGFSIFDITGKSTQFNPTFDRIIYRNRYSKLSITGGLKVKRNESYLEDIELNDRKLTIGSLGLSHSRLFYKGLLGIDFTYDRGLPWFEAEKNDKTSKKNPKSEFNRYNLIINWYKPINLGKKQFIYKFLGVGQYSDDTMHQSEKISLGDEYTVRGYKEDSLSGDSGYYLRNELSYNLYMKKAGVLTPYIGYDYGEIWNNFTDDKYKKGYISGYALGLKYSINEFYFDLTYSKPLNVSNYITKNQDEVYFKFGVRF